MGGRKLSKAEQAIMKERVFNIIKEYMDEHGYPPFKKELAALVGYHPDTNLTRYIDTLIEEGRIELDPHRSFRSLKIVDKKLDTRRKITMNVQIEFDSSDWDLMFRLMRDYGDSEMPFKGTNQDGESVDISINPDNITTMTYQSNGWIRENVYHDDYTVEELYHGRWKEAIQS